MFLILLLVFVISIGVVGGIVYRNIQLKDNQDTTTKSIVPKNNLPLLSPTTTAEKKEGSIEGKIVLNYLIPEYPNVKDDINVLVSEKDENEANYFSAVNCDKNDDNCIWLISEIGRKRTYGY